jgi:hypothetical protein
MQMKDYYIEFIDVEVPYLHTFTFRVAARTQGRALDFAWRLLRKDPRMKHSREQKLTIKIVPMGKNII